MPAVTATLLIAAGVLAVVWYVMRFRKHALIALEYAGYDKVALIGSSGEFDLRRVYEGLYNMQTLLGRRAELLACALEEANVAHELEPLLSSRDVLQAYFGLKAESLFAPRKFWEIRSFVMRVGGIRYVESCPVKLRLRLLEWEHDTYRWLVTTKMFVWPLARYIDWVDEYEE